MPKYSSHVEAIHHALRCRPGEFRQPGLIAVSLFCALASLPSCGGTSGSESTAPPSQSNAVPQPAGSSSPTAPPDVDIDGGNDGAVAQLPSWVDRYNGPANDNDSPNAIAVDAAGNVYVTGFAGINQSQDFVTIKYNANGNRLWEARYDGPGSTQDSARALLVDAAGNVYVTGTSMSPSASVYATIKYDANGNQLWSASYGGLATGGNFAEALALDNLGNVYVTGTSDAAGIPRQSDYATVKYDSNGNELWVARYNRQIFFDGTHLSGMERPSALAVDAAGNVYVTGTSGEGLLASIATVKYDVTGEQEWAALYDGPDRSQDVGAGIAVDTSGNAYVTGASNGLGTGADYALVKYDTNGQQLWVARHSGFGSMPDSPGPPSLDATGNIYVTGASWASGNERAVATIKYDPLGTQLWVSRYSAGSATTFNAFIVDTAGNTYAAGYREVSGSNYDYATVKFDPNSTPLGAASYDGPFHSVDQPRAIGFDTAGNLYVTGASRGSEQGAGSYIDWATIKYSFLAQ